MKPALVLTALVTLWFSAPASADTLRVAPGAGGDCLASPCGSLEAAYARALHGDVVQLLPGRHGAQEVPGGSKQVTFQGQPGNSIAALDNSAANVTFDGLVLDGAFARNAVFENHGAANVTFKNGSIGNVTDEKGALITGEGFTFDNVVFHDAVMRGNGVHMECVYALDVPRMAIRNSTFTDCAIMDLAFTYGDWWTPLPPAYGDITIENNVFRHSEQEDNGGWHYFSLNIGSTDHGGGTVSGWVVRNNTFENAVNVFPEEAVNSRWVGNIGSWNCVRGMYYSHNVGARCGDSDKLVRPSSSTAAAPAPMGWVDPGAGDFRLRSGSPAIGAGDTGDHPATDRNGYARDGAPDAGAHEFGAGPPAPGSAGNAPAARPRPVLRSARLERRTLCRRARPGCRTSTKLQLRVAGGAARVRITLERANGERVRRSTVKVERTSFSRTVRARGLRADRYRVVVVATDARGQQPQTRRLTLHVR